MGPQHEAYIPVMVRSVGTPIAVQQKLMRHADITTTMNTYGDVVTDEMSTATSKVAGLALNRAQTKRKAS
jgi:integrase